MRRDIRGSRRASRCAEIEGQHEHCGRRQLFWNRCLNYLWLNNFFRRSSESRINFLTADGEGCDGINGSAICTVGW
jgi:hypothetical protein